MTVLRLVRWLLGAISLVGGFAWILINMSARSALLDAFVGCVLAGGGLVLLMPHRVRLPRNQTAVVMTVAALVGTLAGLAVTSTQTGDFVEVAYRGWPFHWASRGAVAADTATAHQLAQGAHWTVNLITLAANLLVFAYAGMLVVWAGVMIRRGRKTAEPAREPIV